MIHIFERFTVVFLVVLIAIMGLVQASLGQDVPETLIVTPTNLRGWTTADTRPGGEVDFITDATAPGGSGALQLTTDATTTAKAQFMHQTETPLSEVSVLGYQTKQNGASFAGGAPSSQVVVNLCGTSGFTTLVYEPYQNGSVLPGQWQTWDVDSGQFWSSRSVTCGSSQVVAGGGGAPFYTLTQLKGMFPDAVVIAFGVNIGSNNPSYDVETDLFTFGNTTYDFELYSTPSTMDDCKNGGWSTYNPPTGPFKNQGQCVSSVVPQTVMP